jgi:hypothetical protein
MEADFNCNLSDAEESDSELEDCEWYVDLVLEGKGYVDQVDSIINARDDVMCSEICPCQVENWDLWGAEFPTTGLYKDAEDGVDDWDDCQIRLDAA